ncbi:MAG: DNA mismatch repair endonuclease MutL [Bacillota bacterium]
MTPDETVTPDETIVVLDNETVNKIAAGEVIERPASVVKELVENAIDAGASGITIELRGMPGEFIRVSDDGCGMSRRDARMAFLRHATSKIRTAADLETILTMGFRGEALASIAAVARLELVTRRAQDNVGSRIVYEGGALTLEEDAPSPVGTAVTCCGLFFNTPARRKFQRRPSTELGHIYDVAGRLALAQPATRFRLIHDGKQIILAQGQNDRRAALAAIHGAGLAKVLLPVVAGSARTRIDGFISPPDVTRPTRDAQCIFVNGRPVAAPSIVRAIEGTYGKRLPPRRYPAVFIWISTDPRSIDVNVHPAKREVRFSQDHEVFHLVTQAVSAALHSVGASPGFGRKLGEGGRPAQAQGWSGGLRGSLVQDHDPGDRAGQALVRDGAAPYGAGYGAESCPAGLGVEPGAGLGHDGTAHAGPLPAPSFTPLGTFLGTYILATDGSNLLIIDQHAAHERVLYESFLDGATRGPASVQTLLPVALELRAATVASVSQHLGDLARMGIILEEFGPSSLLLRGIPVALGCLRGADVADAVSAALEAFAEEIPRGGQNPGDALGRFAAEVACKAAVKAHGALEPSEVERLLIDLARAGDPYSCPHGRPTLLRISQAELERTFRRR